MFWKKRFKFFSLSNFLNQRFVSDILCVLAQKIININNDVLLVIVALVLLSGGIQKANSQSYAGYNAVAGWNAFLIKNCAVTAWPNANLMDTFFNISF